jgi:CubicO group peptidase (beta-lactamase class C family)
LRFGSFITRGADSPIPLADFTKEYLTPGGAYYDKRANFKSRAPGTRDDYSNMGITLVGYLVEVISGTPFDQYCNNHIFKPLDMHKTSWRLAGMDKSTLAVPYDKSSSGYVPYGHYGEPSYPDGMLRTSVVELARFLMAYMQGGQYKGRLILKATTIAEMLMSQTPLDLAQGLVWYRESIGWRANRRMLWGHDGSDFGAGAKMWFDPSRRVGVILMTNGVWKFKRAGKLLARLFKEADEYWRSPSPG